MTLRCRPDSTALGEGSLDASFQTGRDRGASEGLATSQRVRLPDLDGSGQLCGSVGTNDIEEDEPGAAGARVDILGKQVQPDPVIPEVVEELEQVSDRLAGQIGSGHDRHLIDTVEAGEDVLPAYVALSESDLGAEVDKGADHKIPTVFDRLPYVFEALRGSPFGVGLTHSVDNDTILHSYIELQKPDLSICF